MKRRKINQGFRHGPRLQIGDESTSQQRGGAGEVGG